MNHRYWITHRPEFIVGDDTRVGSVWLDACRGSGARTGRRAGNGENAGDRRQNGKNE